MDFELNVNPNLCRFTRTGTAKFVKDISSKVAMTFEEAQIEATVQAAKSTRTSLSYQTRGTRVKDQISFGLKRQDIEP
jgi:hypothetical protein